MFLSHVLSSFENTCSVVTTTTQTSLPILPHQQTDRMNYNHNHSGSTNNASGIWIISDSHHDTNSFAFTLLSNIRGIYRPLSYFLYNNHHSRQGIDMGDLDDLLFLQLTKSSLLKQSKQSFFSRNWRNSNNEDYNDYHHHSLGAYPSISKLIHGLNYQMNDDDVDIQTDWITSSSNRIAFSYSFQFQRWCFGEFNAYKTNQNYDYNITKQKGMLCFQNNQIHDSINNPGFPFSPNGQWLLFYYDIDYMKNNNNSNHHQQQEQSVGNNDSRQPLATVSVSCPEHTIKQPQQTKVIPNSNNDNHHHHNETNNLQFLLFEKPATTLLITLNLLLAFLYWNSYTQHSSISFMYRRMISPHYELYRSFTSTTAHFEIIHLAFNMMSLYSLGIQLENIQYPSIPFFFYNICLIPLTTLVEMGIIQLQLLYTENASASNSTSTSTSTNISTRSSSYADVSSVGYSGVIFAWVVVLALERSQSCPIFFLPDICFQTIPIFHDTIKFNLAPFVQLVVNKIIIPRASFIGHLSGILCGFLIHWGLFPTELLLSPQVLLPTFLLWHSWKVRHIIPANHQVLTISNQDGPLTHTAIVNTNTNSSSSTSFVCYLLSKYIIVPFRQGKYYWTTAPNMISPAINLLMNTRILILFVTIFSSFVFEPMGSHVLAQVVSTCILYNATQYSFILFLAKDYGFQEREMSTEKYHAHILWKYTILSFTLLIMTDIMTLSSWIFLEEGVIHARMDNNPCVFFHHSPHSLVYATSFLILRVTINFFSLILAAGALQDLGGQRGEDDHPFEKNPYGKVFSWIARVGADLRSDLFYRQSSSFIAYSGRGFVLGDCDQGATSSTSHYSSSIGSKSNIPTITEII